jgi:hypothetical protein
MEVDETITEVFEKRQLKWAGILFRMEFTRIPKMVYK